MNLDIILIGAPIALLLAGGVILRLVGDIRKLQAIVLDLELSSATARQDGKVEGWAECETKWRNEPLYQIGFETAKVGEYDKGFKAAMVKYVGEVAQEMEKLRESGELQNKL